MGEDEYLGPEGREWVLAFAAWEAGKGVSPSD